MDWAILIFEILLTVAVFLIGLFVKNYLPSYMDEKGKNLATKEDIEEITRKTEEVQQEFREGFELFSNDVKFKYDFFYKQYSELYCKLYAIIIQSEYVRHFIELTDKRNMQKLSLQKEYVEDWKQLVESIMIDWNYDGVVMQPMVTDVPDKKEFVAGIYDIPEDAGTIKVKITDLLSESLEVEV